MTLSNAPGNARANSAAYLSAMRTLLGDRDPVESLEDLMPSLERELSGLQEHHLRVAEAPGKWAILQVLEHLADNELIWGYRLRMILASETPDIQPYDQNRWADVLHWQERTLLETMTDLGALRRRNLRLVRSLSADELCRVGEHRERGQESAAQLIWLTAAHDLAHLKHVRRIRERVQG